MKQLEIIHLRSSGEPAEALSSRIRESIREEDASTQVVTLYRRRGLETDVAIHIDHPSDEPSGLGVRLASALRAFGIVEHTTWEELT
ncbi:MAG: hypothetical protein GY851_15240 [bacterium]|nr:hypothetical protein [bacterium]